MGRLVEAARLPEVSPSELAAIPDDALPDIVEALVSVPWVRESLLKYTAQTHTRVAAWDPFQGVLEAEKGG